MNGASQYGEAQEPQNTGVPKIANDSQQPPKAKAVPQAGTDCQNCEQVSQGHGANFSEQKVGLAR